MITTLVILPLIGALIAGLFSKVINRALAEWLTTTLTSISAILSAIVFYDVAIEGNVQVVQIGTWLSSGAFAADWALRVDVLTAVMLVVVTWVSAVVHMYSIGYMHEDPHTPRFFAYLSLFTFSMLMLVTADNFVQLFFGWEGVGLCSYLLIGFWYKKPSANAAAMKAFIVNRVGDFGFALGIFLIFYLFGSVQFDTVFANVSTVANQSMTLLGYEVHAITLACTLLFIGAMGKSAQLGLHTWLPDAMEGPTPVSALIHAATMVTAGVFLVARCSPLFEHAPIALNMIIIVGALTSIFAATIAITQNDIKKVIAYSTCSQLGYMFFACGLSAYAAGVFHLMTHGFFKALLFLSAGSVIHALHHEQDMRNMGGVWKKLIITCICVWIGSLAIVGMPPFAGYYSKDAILAAAYSKHTELGDFAFWIGTITAFLTAFYSWRLIFLTFNGKTRASRKTFDHAHESPAVMLIPLFILAFGAIASGYFGASILHMTAGDHGFWQGAIQVMENNNILEHAHHAPGWTKIVTFAGIGLAFLFYYLDPKLPHAVATLFSPIYKLFLNKWYIDELYALIFIAPTKWLGKILGKVFDRRIIDGLGPNGMAWLSHNIGGKVSKVQTGYVYHYAFIILASLMLMVGWLLYRGWL